MRHSPRRFLRLLAQAAAASLALSNPEASSQDIAGPGGIVLDEVAPDSQIARAGLRAGDVLYRWERLPSPPANPEPAEGTFTSPFDWMELEVEQAYRGTVVLYGERGGVKRAWPVTPGEWDVHFNQEARKRSRARPLLSQAEARLYEQGQARIRRNRAVEGVALWLRLAEQIPPGRNDPVRCWLLLRIGEVWGESRAWQEAQAAFQEAMAWARADRHRVFLYEALGKSLEYRSFFQEAADRYRAGLEIRRATAPESLGEARSLHQIASQDRNLGNLDAARKGYDQALLLRVRWAPGSFQEADSLHAQGLLAIDHGDLDSAEHYLKRALAIQERLTTQSFWMAFKLESLGDVYALRGDLDLAAYHYERALEIRRRVTPEGDAVAGALNRLGRLKLDQGQWQEARLLFNEALSLLHRVFPRHPQVATALIHLGDAALLAGELGRARSSYRRALALLGDVAPESPASAQSWNGLAEVETRRGNWAGAVSHHQKALALYRRVGSGTDGEARTLAGLGRLAARTGDREGASRLFREAIQALESQVGRLGGSEDVKAEYRSLRHRVYQDATAAELDLGRTEAAFNLQEASRGQSFLSQLATRDLRIFDGLPPELEQEWRRSHHLLRKALTVVNSISAARSPRKMEEARHELALRRERVDAIGQQIRRLSPRSAALYFPQPLTLTEVARELDPGMKLVSYQVGEAETLVFVLAGDGQVTASRLPVGAAALQRELDRFRTLRQNASRRSGPSVLDPLHRLYRAVVQPIEPLLAGADRLLLLPDGPLHAVPWAALVRETESAASAERNWRFLVEWKPFSVALSATIWAELKRSRGRWPAAPEEGRSTTGRALSIAAFGDPQFRAPLPPGPEPVSPSQARLARALRQGGPDLPPLPFSRREVEALTRLFPGQVAAYLGSEATEERAKSLPRGTRIVHFATHGLVDEQLPMSSGLLLTPPDRPDETTEDGFLQAWEIFETVRLDADLVVLSACDSGRGKELGGEGLQSLTRAFQFAGARAVVASLWQVPDEEAADLMVRFYRHLKDGAAAADALRQAQLERIAEGSWGRRLGEAGREGDRAVDLVWAAFEVFGDWR